MLVPGAILSNRGSAIAVEFAFTTVQERPTGEVVEQDDITENFRFLQQDRLSSQETGDGNDAASNEPGATPDVEAGHAAELEAVNLLLEEVDP